MNEQTLRILANAALSESPYPNPMFPPSPYYRFLRQLAQAIRPNLSVELGVCGGGGSLHLALGNPAGQVVGVDVAYDHPQQIEHIVSVCSNFTFWPGDSILSAPAIFGAFGPVGILFVDTIHTYEHTTAEFKTWLPYLSDQVIVCFDDLFRPGMNNFWNELPGQKIRIDELHEKAEDGGGFGIWWR